MAYQGFPVVLVAKNPLANAGDIGDAGSIPGQEDPLEEEMATHSCILAWRIPWTEEPGRLQSIGSQRVGHSSAQHELGNRPSNYFENTTH